MTLDELTWRIEEFLAANDPAGSDRLDFLRARYDAGLAWVYFPVGHGGLGLSRSLQPEVDRLFAEAGAPDNNPGANVIGLGMAGPTILACGTEEQKRRFLRPLCSYREVYAGEEAVQLHGGVGTTREYPAHQYLARAKADQLAFATAGAQRARPAELVEVPRS
ncbi:acyl-CoA dehydrogenase family protein [Nocardia sp. No.11]|uniref:acyl-CoA dehydrogenase family protein n=1 Tax=Nocardia sp. No.11 TaxID=3128861 RepID=UPI00319E6C3C